uniref:Secreted protein n=1 Tax=Daphnia galeata TaxID=27404 RepID=A0A8J2RCV3_9CRUS|nr:unnamed protein product [Daphnia galeata]
MIRPIRLPWSLIAIVSLSVTVVTLSSSVLNAQQVGTNVIRAKREPQHFLGVIIESALTGQHHGFGHRPPFYGYGNQEQPQRHWWIPQWWPKRKSRESHVGNRSE